MKKATGRTPEELIGPTFPERLTHVWEMFLNLHMGRTYSMGSPNPLSWSDIKAWDDLMRVGLKEWEVRAIKALDMAWLSALGEESDDG